MKAISKQRVIINILTISCVVAANVYNFNFTANQGCDTGICALKILVFDIPVLGLWLLHLAATNATIRGSRAGIVLSSIVLILLSIFCFWWIVGSGGSNEINHLWQFSAIYLSSIVTLLFFKRFRAQRLEKLSRTQKNL